MYQLDGHIGCAVAGITGEMREQRTKERIALKKKKLMPSKTPIAPPFSLLASLTLELQKKKKKKTADANILINSARLAAQRHAFAFGEPVPVEQLVRALCDAKQGYTQFGGLRPYGVSLLYGGWDRERGFQLYQSDPSGNYSGWKATAVGAGAAAAQAILRADYHKKTKKGEGGGGGGGEDKWKEGKAAAEGGDGEKKKKSGEDGGGDDERPDIEAALALAVKVLSKTMDSAALTADKVELSTITRDPETGYVRYKIYDAADLAPLLEAANVEAAKAKEAEDK